MRFSGLVLDLFKQLASVLSTEVDMSGMRALLVASIVAIAAGCELKEFNNAAGLFLSTCMDSGVVGVFRFVFRVVWELGRQKHK